MAADFYCERDIMVAGQSRCSRQCASCISHCAVAAATSLDTNYLDEPE